MDARLYKKIILAFCLTLISACPVKSGAPPMEGGVLFTSAAVEFVPDTLSGNHPDVIPVSSLPAESLLESNNIALFPDKILENCIRRQIGKAEGEIFTDDVKGIKSLSIVGKKITDLEGMQFMTGLESLEIRNADVTNIRPLASLRGLKSLNLSYNEISDIGPVSNLVNLNDLDLASNNIEDISPLKNLQGLRKLNLYSNEIKVIEPLRNLITLTDLDLYINKANNIEPLGGLYNLERLSLGINGISDLTPLAKLSELKVLEARENEITSLGGLGTLGNLEELYLSENRIASLDGLQTLLNLRYLELSGNRIKSLIPLRNLGLLKTLNLDRNQIENVSGLENLSQLKSLRLENNMITDISALGGLKKLNSLTVGNNRISDISALGGLRELMNLEISKNKISDISALRGNEYLPPAAVGIQGNPLPDYVFDEATKDGFILARMLPYLHDAIDEYYGVSRSFMNEKILSIEDTGPKYRLRIYLETFTGAHNPPYGEDVVTLLVDYKEVLVEGFEHDEDPPLNKYYNKEYCVMFKYPADWKKNATETLSDRYDGKDGFFMVDAMTGGDYLTAYPIDEIAKRDAYHKLMIYGTKPQITSFKIDRMEARLISPSPDQPEAPPYSSELIVKYPGPVEINGSIYHYFILYADSVHIMDIAKTIRFTYLFE